MAKLTPYPDWYKGERVKHISESKWVWVAFMIVVIMLVFDLLIILFLL